MTATSRDAAPAVSPRPAPPARVTRNRFLRQAIGGLAIAAVGLKTVGEQTAKAAVTFGETVSGAGAWGLRILNSSTAANAAGLRAELTATTPGTNSAAVRGINKGTSINSHGIWGNHAGSGNGLYGSAVDGTGVRGLHSAINGAAPGVRGDTSSQTADATGVLGIATSDNAGAGSAGVKGVNNGLDSNVYGVLGTAATGTGVRGESDNFGVSGVSTAILGYGIHGSALGDFGKGVAGFGDSPTGANVGVFGSTSSPDGVGVEGRSSNVAVSGSNAVAGSIGLLATTTEGVIGTKYHPTSGALSSIGKLATATDGVFGSAKGGTGVRGLHTATTGVNPGVRGDTSSQAISAVAVLGMVTSAAAGRYSAGVKGVNNGTDFESYGVFGTSVAGTGVRGEARYAGVSGVSSIGTGVKGTTAGVYAAGVIGYASSATGTTWGVSGETNSPAGTGVEGRSSHVGVSGHNFVSERRGRLATTAEGVVGESLDLGDLTTVLTKGKLGTAFDGVFGQSDVDSGNGVVGVANGPGSPYAIWGQSSTGKAGYFDGNVHIVGDLSLDGAISAPTKHFVIDHPLDPTNQYLTHASIETSELLNLYSGNITLDDQGAATVALPAWFEALNHDLRYQLTAIGAPPRELHVADELRDNHFQIAGGVPGSKVSWQVAGVRQDAYAIAHPMQVERAKPAGERGTYLHPEAHGQAREAGLATTRLRAKERAASTLP